MLTFCVCCDSDSITTRRTMYKLYWDQGTAAMAPQIVLEEAALDYERVRVDTRSGETRAAAYLALNPAGYVPALVTDEDVILYESAAICLYLCDHHGLALAPATDDPARGLMYRCLFYLTNTVQEAYKQHYYPERLTTDPADAPRISAKGTENLVERWKVVDDHLAAAGPLHLGERASVVDIYMLMLVTWFPPHWQPLLDRYAALKQAFELTAERPAVRKVMRLHGID